ncbi:GIY-YIG nuclease family protein [Roseovarius sp. MBR-6]|jgi:hypothetical protein|uniref:GIY-YIG nuclease family protein n=1 Tax=Roseovarius sp. MBR-6 TaxID=3156459 RepID=UPI0033936372
MSASVIPMPATHEPGWVYILENPSIPGMVKVGRTTRSPELRAQELHDTSTPTPFRVAHSWAVADVVTAERTAHAALGRFRVSSDREWFTLPASHAATLLNKSLGARDAMRAPKRRFHRLRVAVELWGWFCLAAFTFALITNGGTTP